MKTLEILIKERKEIEKKYKENPSEELQLMWCEKLKEIADHME